MPLSLRDLLPQHDTRFYGFSFLDGFDSPVGARLREDTLLVPLTAILTTLLLCVPVPEDLADGLHAYQTRDYAKALEEFAPLARRGNVAAQFSLGWMYDQGQGVMRDYKEAAKWFHAAADKGDAVAQFSLGVAYEEGRGVTQDSSMAAKWFRAAAEQGLAVSQFALATAYERGRGAPRDFREAVRWYRAAAAQGQVDAQFSLGVAYARGRGITHDSVQAYVWLSLAGLRGEARAFASRDTVARKMTPTQIAEAQRLAKEWTPKN